MSQAFILHKDDPHRPSILANAVAFLGKLPASKSWRIDIKRSVKERTCPQNRALFGLAYPVLSDQTGFTVDELHEAFCKRFFGTVTHDVFGQRVSKPFRTTTTDENGKRDVMPAEAFGRFFGMVQQVGAEAGVYVPDPDPTHGRFAL